MNKILFILLGAIFLASCSRPTASFLYEQYRKDAPAKIKFVNQSQNAENYLWDMGDGTYIESETVEHRYILSGVYQVKLTAIKGNKKNTSTKEVVIDPPKECLVEIETNHGTMIARLYDETPLHRDNFLKLADQGFYDGLIFHRVIENFMIQGGDPNSKNPKQNENLGSGGPGYQIDSEFNLNLVHKKGALAAARQPDQVNPEKRSSGSQFYIVHGKELSATDIERLERRKGIAYTQEIKDSYQKLGGYPPLDYDYTVFGEIIEGLEIIDQIANTKTKPRDRPIEDVTMKIRVIK